MKTEVPSVEGTGFLIANGRGLGITARHVAEALRSKTPSVDQLEQTVTDLRSARRHRWRLWIAVGVDEAIAVAWMLLAAPAVVTRVSPR